MVKDHSDSEKGNLLPPHRLLFSIKSFIELYYQVLKADIKQTTFSSYVSLKLAFGYFVS